jgi:hypothetical protein
MEMAGREGSDRSRSRRSPFLVSDCTVEGIGRVAVAIGGRSDRSSSRPISEVQRLDSGKGCRVEREAIAQVQSDRPPVAIFGVQRLDMEMAAREGSDCSGSKRLPIQ